MRIGIDARLWGEEENRGLGRYVKELVLSLEKVSPRSDEFYIFLTKKNFDAYRPSTPNFKKILWDVPWYTVKEQLGTIPFGDSPLDLMHFPHWNVPYFYNKPFIVTIHDLILLESSRQREATTLGKTKYALKFTGFKLVLNHTLKKTKKIIAVSESTKKSIIKYSPMAADKIEVVYEGVTPLSLLQPQVEEEKGERSKKIAQPYLLYVGSAYPHKNLEFLIKAFTDFNQDKKYQLVLVGREDFFYKRLKVATGFMPARLKSASINGAATTSSHIIFWGQATNQELATLYQNAALFVSASLAEGFGFPPLEAALLNTPSLLSDIDAFREVMGETAVYFNPQNPQDFEDKLRLALEKSDLRDKITKEKEITMKKFNWQECASKTLALYHKNHEKT